MSLIQRHIDADYPVFQASEMVSAVLSRFQELGLEEAPVLKGDSFFALVSSDCLLRAAQAEDDVQLGQMRFNEPGTLYEDEHVLDAFDRLSDNRAGNLLPVTDQDGGYKGVVIKSELLKEIAGIFHFSETGSTLEIEAPALGIKVSEIIGVIEKNDATVLSFGIVEPEPGAQTMVMTFRIQSQDIYRLVTNLERYGYFIRYAKPSVDGGADELREKALEFMRYIDM